MLVAANTTPVINAIFFDATPTPYHRLKSKNEWGFAIKFSLLVGIEK